MGQGSRPVIWYNYIIQDERARHSAFVILMKPEQICRAPIGVVQVAFERDRADDFRIAPVEDLELPEDATDRGDGDRDLRVRLALQAVALYQELVSVPCDEVLIGMFGNRDPDRASNALGVLETRPQKCRKALNGGGVRLEFGGRVGDVHFAASALVLRRLAPIHRLTRRTEPSGFLRRLVATLSGKTLFPMSCVSALTLP